MELGDSEFKFFTTIFSFFSLFLFSHLISLDQPFFFFLGGFACFFTNLVLGGSICTFTCAFTLSYHRYIQLHPPQCFLSFLFFFLFSRHICTYFESSLILIFFPLFTISSAFSYYFFSFQGELKHKGFLPNLFFGNWIRSLLVDPSGLEM